MDRLLTELVCAIDEREHAVLSEERAKLAPWHADTLISSSEEGPGQRSVESNREMDSARAQTRRHLPRLI